MQQNIFYVTSRTGTLPTHCAASGYFSEKQKSAVHSNADEGFHDVAMIGIFVIPLFHLSPITLVLV